MQIIPILSFFMLFFFQAILAKNSVINEKETVDKIYGLCGAPPPIEPTEVQFVKGPLSPYKAGEPEFVNMKIRVEYNETIVEKLHISQIEQLKRSVNESVEFYQKILKIRSGDRDEIPKVMKDEFNEVIQKEHDQYRADFHLNVDYGCENSCCDGTESPVAWASILLVKNSTLPDGTFQPWHRRPFVGRCYICQGEHLSGIPQDYQMILSLVKHEMLHVFGFNQEHIQKRLEEREINWKVTEKRSWKKKVAYYTGPPTRDAARAHFGCPDLDGAEVEDFGGIGTRYNHWDKRAFGPELMTGELSQKSFFSNITASFLRELGWYEVDDSMIDYDTYWYGKNKSCEFAMKSCRSYMDYAEKNAALQKLHAPAIPYCSEKNAWLYQEQTGYSRNFHSPLTCSSDRSMYMQCYLTTEEKDGWNQSHYGYFSDKGNIILKVHGGRKMLDFCPVFLEPENSLCTNVHNQPGVLNNLNAMLFGESSLCLEHGQNFVKANCSTWTPFSDSDRTKSWRSRLGAGCYDHKCFNGQLMIRTFAAEETEGVDRFEICLASGEEILIRRRLMPILDCVTGTIICPKCEDICEGKNDGFKCAEPVNGATPVDKITPSLVDQVTPDLVNQITPDPEDQITSSPVDQITSDPVDQITSNPVDQPTPKPVDQGTPKPVDQVTPNLVDQVTSKLVDQVTPSPVDKITPSLVDKITPSPVDKITTSLVGKTTPTSSGSGNFPSLVIPMTVILMHDDFSAIFLSMIFFHDVHDFS